MTTTIWIALGCAFAAWLVTYALVRINKGEDKE